MDSQLCLEMKHIEMNDRNLLTNRFQIFNDSALPDAINISSELNAKHRTSVR